MIVGIGKDSVDTNQASIALYSLVNSSAAKRSALSIDASQRAGTSTRRTRLIQMLPTAS